MLYIDPDGLHRLRRLRRRVPGQRDRPADYDLPDELVQFTELNAAYFRDPAHRATPTARPIAGPPPGRRAGPEPLRVAIVGSGPAACYAAGGAADADAVSTVEVDMFERLMTPWGLVRFGVAPDHATTKQATDAFARTIAADRTSGSSSVSRSAPTSATRTCSSRYHAVVYAVGAMADRSLGVPGEDLPGSHSATEFVAWYNGHPDYADRTFDFSGERAVVIGNGNVALDVARILLRDVESHAPYRHRRPRARGARRQQPA